MTATTHRRVERPTGQLRFRTARILLASVRVPPLDAGVVLAVFAVLLLVLPGRLVIANMGAAGRPAVAVGLGIGALWLIGRLNPDRWTLGRQPVRWLVITWVLVMLLAYSSGLTRGVTAAEVRGADRGLIVLMSCAGLAMFAMDELRSIQRLELVLRWVTYGAAISSAIALVQFRLGIDLTSYIRLPGLRLNNSLIGITSRGFDMTFRRVAGTAGHPIEFGVLTSMALPLALHLAMFAAPGKDRRRRWCIVAILAMGVPFSISRAAVIGIVAGVGAVAAVWNRRLQWRALVSAAAFIVVVRLTVPGLVGTIRGLFTYADQDSSIEARTSDYDLVETLVAQRPLLGRGPGTFLPDEYFILDNEYLGTLVSAGVLGLLALVALYVGGYQVARVVYRRRSMDERTRHLAQCLAASMLVAMASSIAFDAFAFAGFTGMFWLLLGCVGALYRITSRDAAVDPPAAERRVLRN